jgi:Putative heavy-metal-binding
MAVTCIALAIPTSPKGDLLMIMTTYFDPTWVYDFSQFIWATESDSNNFTATSNAINRLLGLAASYNANAVVNVQIASSHAGNYTVVWVYGTALRINNY